jgi:hypothetical protein
MSVDKYNELLRVSRVRITLCSLHGILSASIGQWIGFPLNDADDADGLWKFVG